MTEVARIDLFSPEYRADPFRYYAYARTHEPVYKVAMPGDNYAWLITRYEDAEEILRDPRFIKNPRSLLPEEQREAPGTPYEQVFQQISRHMLSSDPPDHTRLRGLVNKAFTPNMVERLRGRVQAIADDLLAHLPEHGEMELITDFAFPLPMTVISEMLGIPEQDRAQFRDWSNTVVSSFGNPNAPDDTVTKLEAFGRYLFQFSAARRAQPQDDLVSKLVQVESEGDKLSEYELISMIFLLLVAGHETTVNLIGNGILALLLHPDQKEKLQQDPTLVKPAIEELLRYNSPLYTATGRWAREDVHFKGTLIQRGEIVLVGLSSANHDETQFSHSEELDITRKDNHHLAFGKGIHYCLGAPLARLEGQIAIPTILKHLPDLRLNADPRVLTWRPGTLVHALDRLPVAF